MTELEIKQQEMEARFQNLQNRSTNPDEFNWMINPSFYACSYEQKQLTLSFPTEPWERNPHDVLHGGMICTFFDCTFGCLTAYLTGESITTIQLSTSYLKPVQIGETALVTVKASSIGKTIIHLTGELWCKESGILASTATAAFMILKKPLKN